MVGQLAWDTTGKRFYESGVDHGVLYLPNTEGLYNTGFAWNGLTAVTEAPSGAESNAQYADNIKYLNLLSAEEFGGTIEAFTYPDEFGICDGTISPSEGLIIGQQSRKSFGLSYRTKVGNDTDGQDHGYKLHLVYGALATPSEKAFSTINDSPEPITFSWEFSTSPVQVNDTIKPTSLITIDSTKIDAVKLAALEKILYGTNAVTDPVAPAVEPRLPSPLEILTLLAP